MNLFNLLRICSALLSLLLLGSCGKTYDPNAPENRPCLEQLKVFDVKGQKAWKTIGGQYIRVGSMGPNCGKLDDKAKINEYVTGGIGGYEWLIGEGRFWNEGVAKLPKTNEGFPDMSKIDHVKLYFTFSSSPPRKYEPVPDWWYETALPHKLYPIDLLPNWGLDKPGGKRVGGIDSHYWAVRGTKSPESGKPYINMYCEMVYEPMEMYSHRELAKELERAIKPAGGKGQNTCRGSISASSGKISAMIDTPSTLVPEMDKVFNAVSLKLSDIVIEE